MPPTQPEPDNPSSPAAAGGSDGTNTGQVMDASVPAPGPTFDTHYNLFLQPPQDPALITAKPFFTPPVTALAPSANPAPAQSPAPPMVLPANSVITPTVPVTPDGSQAPTTAATPAATAAQPLGAMSVLNTSASQGPTPAAADPSLNPATPVNGVSQLAPGDTVAVQPGKKPRAKGKRTLFIVAVVALILILGGGYVFAVVVPNQPSSVYNTALDHTARAYDKLVTYTGGVGDAKYKSGKLDGGFKLTSGSVSGDGTFTGQSDDKNSTATINVDIAGEKIGVNTRSITASGQTTPDLYFQVNGIKTILNGYGLTQLASLDGQWVSVDHTLLETAAASAANDTKPTDLKAPTAAQIQSGLTTIGQVDRQYLFKADAGHAVLTNKKYLGKSTRDGRQVYGYQVGYNKPHLKAYIKALQTGLGESSLDTWAKQVSGKSIKDADLNSFLAQIDKADASYTFTMYVDAKTKLISTLHFKDTKSNDYFEIGQGYTGGSVYPFSFKFVSTSDPANAGTFNLDAKLDSATNKISTDAKLDIKQGGSPISFSANANLSFSNDSLKVVAPTGAKSVMDVYQSLGLNDLLGASTSTSSLDAASSDLFTLTQ
jgi:hypothetical protein